MSETTINITLEVWRQNGPNEKGHFETYEAKEISTDSSFLEMLDEVNEGLVQAEKIPITFESDCREGICGTCSLMIDGQAHGPNKGQATCQLHMRTFKDGDHITIEPFRATSLPVIKDLAVSRAAMDKIQQAGGYVTIATGSAPDANLIPVPKEAADLAMDAAQCIGCGACVAACPNSAAQLFTSAKVNHLNLLPQGQSERWKRVEEMVDTMEDFFGTCSNHGECYEACPKEISLDFIAFMNRDYVKAKVKNRKLSGQS